jgi:multidrug efflux pump subunit AcrA (membrane-fusion protein)
MKVSSTLSTSVVLWIIAGIVMLGGAGLYFARTSSGENNRRLPAPLVRISPPTRGTVVQTLDFTGDVVAIQQATIFAKVTGNLEKTFVDIGSPVRQNQRLALIDTTVLHQQYLLTHAPMKTPGSIMSVRRSYFSRISFRRRTVTTLKLQ